MNESSENVGISTDSTAEASERRLPAFTVTVGGEEYEAEVAVCERFSLGVEDHGLFTADASFSNGGWVQGLGAYGLDEFDKATQRRHGTAFGCDFIMRLVGILGSPEEAKGRRVLVLRKQAYGLICGVAKLNDDGTYGEPCMPKALAEQH